MILTTSQLILLVILFISIIIGLLLIGYYLMNKNRKRTFSNKYKDSLLKNQNSDDLPFDDNLPVNSENKIINHSYHYKVINNQGYPKNRMYKKTKPGDFIIITDGSSVTDFNYNHKIVRDEINEETKFLIRKTNLKRIYNAFVCIPNHYQSFDQDLEIENLDTHEILYLNSRHVEIVSLNFLLN